MKMHIDLPWGGTFDFEHKPLDNERFEMICWLIGVVLFGSGVLKLFLSVT